MQKEQKKPADNLTQSLSENNNVEISSKPAAGRLIPRLTIAWKITGVVILVMFVLAVINIIFTRNRFTSVMENEFLSKGRTIASSLATSSEDKLFAGYFDVVQDLVDASSEIPGVRYIFITDKKGEVVAHTFEGGFLKSIRDLNPVKSDEEFRIAEIHLPEVGKVMEVAVPIISGAAGTAHVGMDRGIILDEVRDITTSLIIQFTVASILGIILLHLTVQFLLRHMKTILDVLTRVGGGDLSVRLDVPTSDEFGVLGDQLNATLERLSSIVLGVRHSFQSISRAHESIIRVYGEVLEGSDQQANLASETMESVTHSKKLMDEVTQGIHVLDGSASDSFSSIIEMGASIEEVSAVSDSLFRSVNDMNEAIKNMSSSIAEISENLLSLSTATEETASSMSEMSVSIQQVRENAESTSADAVQMTQIAEEGVGVSKHAMKGTLAIKESSAQVSHLISVVTERIEEIDQILSFITDITGKTNLLALNAAIIASQAGEQGKGFGIVAGEINELAQNTKAQTNRIAGVIKGIRDEVQKTGEAVEVATGKVEEGVQLTEQVTTSLEKIVNSTTQVSQRVEEIARTTSEQANTSSRVMEATEQLNTSVKNIREVGQIQSESGEKLLEMSKQIQLVAQKVKTSTEEQTSTSQLINSELTKISDSVHRISESTDIQVANGNKVFSKTEDLTGIIEKNRKAVHGLQEVISELAERMDSLQGELSVLVVQEGDS